MVIRTWVLHQQLRVCAYPRPIFRKRDQGEAAFTEALTGVEEDLAVRSAFQPIEIIQELENAYEDEVEMLAHVIIVTIVEETANPVGIARIRLLRWRPQGVTQRGILAHPQETLACGRCGCRAVS